MAYAALVSLAQLLDTLLDQNQDQDHILLPGKQQIRSLYENIVSLIAFLEEFPEDEDAAILEQRITSAANQAEDIIEYHISDEIRSSGTLFSCVHQVVWCLQVALFSACRKCFEHHNWHLLHKKLKNVIQEITSIAAQAMRIKGKGKGNHPIASHSSSDSRGGGGKSIVMGFEEYLSEIKAQLYEGSSEFQTIPIIGMGGIGKTTLARYVYDSPFTQKHFDCSAWVTISQYFDEKKVLLDILCSTTKQNKNQTPDIGLEVYKSLKGRRYLIVIEDMWDPKVWDSVIGWIAIRRLGSRVL